MIISAVRLFVRRTGASVKDSYSRAIASVVRSSMPPSTIRSGDRKSLSATPSERNSGFIPTPKCSPACLPDARSRIGVTVPSVVPGTTVLLTTTTWYDVFFASDSPMPCAIVRIALRSIASPSNGVGAAIIVRSVACTAASRSRVARTDRPACFSSSGASPSSWIGERPALIASTLVESISTRVTSWPRSARHTPVMRPTYPDPTMESLSGSSGGT